jgi:hypothetical protein
MLNLTADTDTLSSIDMEDSRNGTIGTSSEIEVKTAAYLEACSDQEAPAL